MEKLLARHRDVPSPLKVPPPLSTAASSDDNLGMILAKLTELTMGVNELRASQAHAITRDDLQEFHKACSFEHKALLASQIEPLRDDVNLVVKNQEADSARIGKLETIVAKFEKGKKGVDSSFTKLAVKKFPEDVPLEERIDAMRDFMARYFPKLCATFSIRHRGDWMEKGKNRAMTAVGFIDVGDPDAREFVLREVESRKLSVKCNTKICRLCAP